MGMWAKVVKIRDFPTSEKKGGADKKKEGGLKVGGLFSVGEYRLDSPIRHRKVCFLDAICF